MLRSEAEPNSPWIIFTHWSEDSWKVCTSIHAWQCKTCLQCRINEPRRMLQPKAISRIWSPVLIMCNDFQISRRTNGPISRYQIDFGKSKFPSRIVVAWGFHGTQELMNLFRHTNVNVMCLQLRDLQLVQTMLWIECNSNAKQLLRRQFRQISRNPWGCNRGVLQSVATSTCASWIWTKKADKQQQWCFGCNPSRLEINQQHETIRDWTKSKESWVLGLQWTVTD